MFDEAEESLYSARPRIFIDGAEDPSLAGNLLALSVETAESTPARCTARFINWGQAGDEIGYLYFDLARFDFGRAFRVLVAEDDELFRGRVMALQALYPQDRPPEIQVVAEDGLEALAAARHSRSFADVSAADIFERIAAEHGLQLDLDADSAAETLPQLAQLDQSDLDFLRQLARRNGWAFRIRSGTLTVRERGFMPPEGPTLDLGGNLRDFRGGADVRGQYAAVRISGWDAEAKEPLEAAARMADLNESLDGLSGPRTVEMQFGARELTEVDQGPRGQAHAEALALASFGARARRFVTGQGMADGDARIQAGGRVVLQGLGDLFNGSYRVTAVQHTFDPEQGFRTGFSVERPWLAPHQGKTGDASRRERRAKDPKLTRPEVSTQETILHQTMEDTPDSIRQDVVDDSQQKETQHARTQR